ncbi:MAG: hypothetical protein JHC28_02540 [Thermoprotei archaeon]|uniref:Uncharacterized protein n=1 Tax=Fervidicoccus fontis TaxID=683846 RepID=A0A7J3SNA6_9CREN|nr:hypothetical protein [Thermoprotei archaeon]
MRKLQMPPRIKVLEALSSVAEGRIKQLSDKEATVVSSDEKREYQVFLDVEKGIANSTDNGTKYRGYIGYPIIAFLMLKGILPYDEEVASKLVGIEWRALNEKYKSYRIVEKIALDRYSKKGGDKDKLEDLVKDIMEKLEKIELFSPDEGEEV